MSSKITTKQTTYNVEMSETELKALSHLLMHVTYRTDNPFYHIAKEVSFIYPDPDPDAITFQVWDDHYENSRYEQHVDIEFRENWDK